MTDHKLLMQIKLIVDEYVIALKNFNDREEAIDNTWKKIESFLREK